MQHLVPNKAGQRLGIIEVYQSYGNQRPPVSVIGRAIGAITNRDCPTFTARLILADMQIDSAMSSQQQSHSRMRQAEDTLDVLIEDIEHLGNAGHEQSFAGQAPNLVTAYLRRAELRNWWNAAKGKPTNHNYDHLLTAAGDVVGLDRYNGEARSRLIEFVPVLLGARGLERGTDGWLGRLTLDREDHRGHMAKGYDTNWDFGVCETATPDSFDNPEIRIDMKTSSHHVARGRRSHSNTNIGVLSASSCGISDPVPVIWSCIGEADGGLPDSVKGVEVLSSGQLDAITRDIAANLPRPQAAA